MPPRENVRCCRSAATARLTLPFFKSFDVEVASVRSQERARFDVCCFAQTPRPATCNVSGVKRGIPIEVQRDSDLFAVLIALSGADGPTFNNQVS